MSKRKDRLFLLHFYSFRYRTQHDDVKLETKIKLYGTHVQIAQRVGIHACDRGESTLYLGLL